jgi:hypothetical protein
MTAKEDFDSIFEDTKSKAKKKPAKKAVKKVAKKAVKPVGAKKVSPAKVAAPAKPEPADDFKVDRFAALSATLSHHEAEALYRKGKEDKILVLACGLLTALTIGIMLVLTTDTVSGGFGKFILRVFFAATVGLVGLSASSMIELNRKRLQDLLAMIVKIQDTFGFFKEGAYPTENGSYFPNTYKYVGSINDDETNYAQMIVKIASVGAVIAVLILS